MTVQPIRFVNVETDAATCIAHAPTHLAEMFALNKRARRIESEAGTYRRVPAADERECATCAKPKRVRRPKPVAVKSDAPALFDAEEATPKKATPKKAKKATPAAADVPVKPAPKTKRPPKSVKKAEEPAPVEEPKPKRVSRSRTFIVIQSTPKKKGGPERICDLITATNVRAARKIAAERGDGYSAEHIYKGLSEQMAAHVATGGVKNATVSRDRRGRISAASATISQASVMPDDEPALVEMATLAALINEPNGDKFGNSLTAFEATAKNVNVKRLANDRVRVHVEYAYA